MTELIKFRITINLVFYHTRTGNIYLFIETPRPLSSPYIRVDEHDDTGTDTLSAFEEKTNQECVAYAAGEGLWKKGIDINEDDWTVSAKDFKYTWKPVDCNLKAPFLCQHNPGILAALHTFRSRFYQLLIGFRYTLFVIFYRFLWIS